MPYQLADLAQQFSCLLQGDGSTIIETVCTLQNGKSNAITFLANPRYRQFLDSTTAGAVILKPEDMSNCPVPCLGHENPYACYARIAQFVSGAKEQRVNEIHPTAVIHETAVLGEGVSIGPCSYVGMGVRIGNNSSIAAGSCIMTNASIGEGSLLHANVTVYHECRVGRNAIVHSGVVIGADGFGIAQDNGEWVKVPQLGKVIIGDNVEIGANTTIDRGAIEDTVLEDGVKLDNQIQIGHNVHIGAHTAMAGCSGVAGSTRIGSGCTIGAAAVVLGHLELADDVHITACSMVTKSIRQAGVYSSGTPLQSNAAWKRNFTRFGQLDDIAKRLATLEKRMKKQ